MVFCVNPWFHTLSVISAECGLRIRCYTNKSAHVEKWLLHQGLTFSVATSDFTLHHWYGGEIWDKLRKFHFLYSSTSQPDLIRWTPKQNILCSFHLLQKLVLCEIWNVQWVLGRWRVFHVSSLTAHWMCNVESWNSPGRFHRCLRWTIWLELRLLLVTESAR